MVFPKRTSAEDGHRQGSQTRTARTLLAGQRQAGAGLSLFLAFLKLGCVCFGGPVAHLGYFRAELVERRKWLTETELGEMIALTQLLPGPSSSQTGFLIGLSRGGVAGAFAAWAGFTLPSAILMLLFGAGVQMLHAPWFSAALEGLALAAVAVVAHAVTSMFRSLCPDVPRALMAIVAGAIAIYFAGGYTQVLIILAGAALGLLALRIADPPSHAPRRIGSPTLSLVAVCVFCAAWTALALLNARLPLAFFRTGALVFGGGHVVLPLLDSAVVSPGWVSRADFLAGYGAAQALPGPLFTFAAYLGYVARIPPSGLWGGLICLAAIFLPGLLLALVAAGVWSPLRRHPKASAALAGVNAAVVGLLMAAFWRASASGVIRGRTDALVAVAAFAALRYVRLPAVWVVLTSAALAVARYYL